MRRFIDDVIKREKIRPILDKEKKRRKEDPLKLSIQNSNEQRNQKSSKTKSMNE